MVADHLYLDLVPYRGSAWTGNGVDHFRSDPRLHALGPVVDLIGNGFAVGRGRGPGRSWKWIDVEVFSCIGMITGPVLETRSW